MLQLSVLESRDQQRRVLRQPDGRVAIVSRGDEKPLVAPPIDVEVHLTVAGRSAKLAGQHPHLQEVQSLVRRVVELGVANAASRAHVLHAAGADDAMIADAVAVFELTRQHVRHDFHVAMRVGRKAGARGYAIVVKDAQRSPVNVTRVVIFGETERVAGEKPAVVERCAFAGALHGEVAINAHPVGPKRSVLIREGS